MAEDRMNPGIDSQVRTICVRLADLLAADGKPLVGPPFDVAEVIPLILTQYDFLPQPVVVSIEGDEVVLQFPAESTAAQAEASRLAERAAKRAAEGNYKKAIDIFRRVLELQPSLHQARRDLAMAYVEIGDIDNATNHLIEVLRLDPGDVWSWVVLANTYIRERSDPETGERFLRKALEIKPDDAWALNSLAVVCQKRGRGKEALALFERSIGANPEFANPYLGVATLQEAANQPKIAAETLQRLFSRARMQDARTQPVYDNARQLYAKLQGTLAAANQPEAFRSVLSYKNDLEVLSGYPVRIEVGEFDDNAGARIQMAWKHGRDHHLIITRRGYDQHLLCHLQAHELTHLKLETEARAVGKNQFFATSANSLETAMQSLKVELRKWRKEGHSEASATRAMQSMVGGLCGFLFNCPLDMLIEHQLRDSFPALGHAQFLSLGVLAKEAWQANSNREIQRLTPRRILRASIALNGAYCLVLDELYQGASAFAASYRSLEGFELAERLHRHWAKRAPNLGAGEEYQLVDEFADMVGLSNWYEWRPDLGTAETRGTVFAGGGTQVPMPQQHPAVVWHLLGALERFGALTDDQVREIAFEIGLVGQSGLDYADPEPKYTLRAIPGEHFSGLQLMCMMYAGFKRIEPDLDTGMDLHEPFLKALALFGQRKSE